MRKKQNPDLGESASDRSFRNSVTLYIEGSRRVGVPWLEAWKRVDWYLTFLRAEQQLGRFLFPR